MATLGAGSVGAKSLDMLDDSEHGLFPPLHFVTAVWGEEYTKVFVGVTLPCLLSRGNIPSVPTGAPCVYMIFTTDNERKIIEQSDAYVRLCQYLKVEFHLISAPIENKHMTSSDCYRLATAEAARAGAAIVYLIPDMIFADGGIHSVVNLLRAGKRAILVMGLRAIKETLVPQVLGKYYADGVITIAPRELVCLAYEHIHSITKSHFYDGNSECFHPSVFCWQVGREGFLLHSFHLQPIALCPRSSSASFTGTIDDDLVKNSGYSDAEIHIVSDSDEVLWFEISAGDYFLPTPKRRGMMDIVLWMRSNTNPYHRSLFPHAIKVHSGTVIGAEWNKVETRANLVVHEALREFDEDQRASHRRDPQDDLLDGSWRFLRRLIARSQSYLDTEGVFVRQFPLSILKLPFAWSLASAFQILRSCVRAFRRV